MAKFIRTFFGYYYLLFALSYISIYKFPPATPVLNIIILLVGYQQILRHQRLDIAVALILFSKSINGFIIYHNRFAYDIVNVLTSILPVLIYLVSVMHYKLPVRPAKLTFRRYLYTTVFLILLTISFALNIQTSYDLVTKRYLPFFLFVVFLYFSGRVADFDPDSFLKFFRAGFAATVIMFFFTNYMGYTKLLLESDSVFSVAMPSNTYSVMYYGLVRNYGYVWDHRILAILGYLYLLLAITRSTKYLTIDIILSGLVVFTTTARGGILTYSIILFAYLINVYRERFFIAFAALGIVVAIGAKFADKLLPANTVAFVRTFNPANKKNAIEQRHEFADESLKHYNNAPILGNGVGFLSSSTIERKVRVKGTYVKVVSDAFWFVLMAEMGLVGLVIFILFLLEVFNSTNMLALALLIGFAIQLIGTDIPDMRFNYLAILIIVYVLNSYLQERTVTVKKALAWQ